MRRIDPSHSPCNPESSARPANLSGNLRKHRRPSECLPAHVAGRRNPAPAISTRLSRHIQIVISRAIYFYF
ncbi:hypothetical protein [Burkholderia ubonensis]|uniref:hypothetical protein n=1 Tax=Burkholderia ubonensis TaxID=101571 RepID=UPI000A40BC3C|nr:hypothetical protein [Burkholderia ubonensis]